MSFVITCGDEGVQLNEGTRLGFVGAGFQLEGFSEAVVLLQKLFDEQLVIAPSEENDWVREKLALSTWEQTNAMAQQKTEALADQNKLLYAGNIPFADPQELAHGVRAHMVRPHGVHIANKLKFTCGGGEQVYNLGCYIISADWLADADDGLVRKVLEPQLAFYKKIAKRDTMVVEVEMDGTLGAERAAANREKLEKLGFVSV
jgi:hypothetical protein